ncbi:MAG: DUF695 domain-containing protein [Pseudomonadota bacterium]
MTENWDFYFCNVDHKPGSIFVDLGALELLPVATHPVMAYLRLRMCTPRPDGLSSNEEYDRLLAIEHALEKLCVEGDTIYVGRCTTNGCRDFYFYTVEGLAWDELIGAFMAAFPDYQFQVGCRDDPSWSSYCSFLYPNEATRHGMRNRRVCTELERHGDPLLVAREIDHWAYFPEVNGRDKFVAKTVQLGFAVRGLSTSEHDGMHCAQLWRLDLPNMSDIDDVTLPLFDLAAESGGQYDGRESVVLGTE